MTLILIVSMALIISSRRFGFESDDFINYYDFFTRIKDYGFSDIFYFGGGIEFGLGIFFYIISIITPNITPNGLIFLTSLFALILYVLFIEIIIIPKFETKYSVFIILFGVLFCDVFFSTQLVRQFIASIFVLFSLFSDKLRVKLLFLIIAVIFHVSSLPIFFLVYIVIRCNFFVNLIVVGILYIYISYFNLIKSYLTGFDPVLAAKLGHLDHAIEMSSTDFYFFKKYILLFMISIIVYFCRKTYSSSKMLIEKEILLKLVIMLALGMVLSSGTFFFSRLYMPINIFLFGYCYFYCFWKLDGNIIKFLLLVILSYKFYVFTIPGSNDLLWSTFHRSSLSLGYYLRYF